jgi:DNA-binding CsgD family transcriptional regulator
MTTGTSASAAAIRPENLGLGLPDRVADFTAMLRDPSFGDVQDNGRAWLQRRYAQIVPLVLPAALQSVESGEPLPAECLRSLRTVAAECADDTDVQLSVILRGALPALRVFAAFMHECAPASPRQTVLAMARATRVAHELGSFWVEAWSDARAVPARGAPQAVPDASVPDRPRPSVTALGGGSIELVAVDPTLTEAESRMLALAAYGHSNERIARDTSYSRQAVGWHLSRIMRAWKTPNRTALVALAFVKGVLVARSAPRTPRALPAKDQAGTRKSLSQPTSS